MERGRKGVTDHSGDRFLGNFDSLCPSVSPSLSLSFLLPSGRGTNSHRQDLPLHQHAHQPRSFRATKRLFGEH
jgi:hypothetical protein